MNIGIRKIEELDDIRATASRHSESKRTVTTRVRLAVVNVSACSEKHADNVHSAPNDCDDERGSPQYSGRVRLLIPPLGSPVPKSWGLSLLRFYPFYIEEILHYPTLPYYPILPNVFKSSS